MHRCSIFALIFFAACFSEAPNVVSDDGTAGSSGGRTSSEPGSSSGSGTGLDVSSFDGDGSTDGDGSADSGSSGTRGPGGTSESGEPPACDAGAAQCVRRVFLTSAAHPSNVTPAVADEICRTDATTAGLGRRDWLAYLQVGDASPWVRAMINPTNDPFRYVDPLGNDLSSTGEEFVLSSAAAAAGLLANLEVDASGSPVWNGNTGTACPKRPKMFPVWTGITSQRKMVVGDDTCSGWTGIGKGGIGYVGGEGLKWAASSVACECAAPPALFATAHLMCVEAPPPVP